MSAQWSAAWDTVVDFVNSNVFTVTVSAFMAAWAGAAGAQATAERTRARAEQLQEIRNLNAAVVLASSVADWGLSLKTQHLQGLQEGFAKLKADYEAYQAAVKERGSGTFTFKPDLTTLGTTVPSMDVLRSLVMEKTTPGSRGLKLVGRLSGASVQLYDCIEVRNKLIAEIKRRNLNAEALLQVCLGLRSADGEIDMRFAQTLEAMVHLCESVIFFAVTLCDDLSTRATTLRTDYGRRFWWRKLPKVTLVHFDEERENGLIPAADAEEYKAWTGSFVAPVEVDSRFRARVLRKLGLLMEN